jgi:AhpD family alkylhydroperoxidase
MQPRLDGTKYLASGGVKALMALQREVESSGLERPLIELVKIRASQLNGCAYCIDMHTKDARAAGETEQRLYLLDAWREAEHLYTDRERAALAWTEALTLVTEGHCPDPVYEQAHAQFSDAEMARLTLAIIAINGWNRLNVGFRTPAGGYRPGMFKNLKLA